MVKEDITSSEVITTSSIIEQKIYWHMSQPTRLPNNNFITPHSQDKSCHITHCV